MSQTVYLGFIASLLAGLATFIGALPVVFIEKLSKGWQGILLGLGGGIMLSATTFSLIIPAKNDATALGYSQQNVALLMSAGIAIGASLLWLIHDNFPHEHFNQGKQGKVTENFQRLWLFVLAITLHNFPEGLAVGMGFSHGGGSSLALGIAIQNMPEGLVVALALRELNYSLRYALGISLATGLVEPIGGLLGATITSFGQAFLPWGLSAAAGSMLFVIVGEIIPEIDAESIAQEGTLGIMVGFILMMFLDTAFG